MKWKESKKERHLVQWDEGPSYRKLPKPPPPKPELGKPMKNYTNKAHSATVRRRIMKLGMSGDQRYAARAEDDPTWNPQTQGNKRYKVGSPAYKNLEKFGEARIQETPHGKGHKLGAKLPSSAIRRRLEMQKDMAGYKKKNKAEADKKKQWVKKPLKERETVS